MDENQLKAHNRVKNLINKTKFNYHTNQLIQIREEMKHCTSGKVMALLLDQEQYHLKSLEF